ncbi:extra-large guanine nucleotide-binding protein 1-like [Phoenix dactylifera]|uniref:Extra-large guanine nucleotide-binding protein 1-like n=1 Tax=Phoenix dactylifera TaxID=42345 RepID=A0A8B7C6D7_PHODC|nr:extra-large guanine nucleotide-binding protein 1-like [Phoenix dactylifera]
MERLLKKMLPAGAPPLAVDSADYPFAIEYHGPPVPYDIPEVIPIEIGRIPVVPSLPSPGPLKKRSKIGRLAVDPAGASPTSVIENHTAMDRLDSVEVRSSGALGSAAFPDRSAELSDGIIDSSGAVGFKEVEGFDGSSEGIDSSGVLGFSGEVKEGEGFEGSWEGTGSSGVVGFSSEFKKGERLEGSPDDTVHGRVLTESALSSESEFRSSALGDDEALNPEAKRAVVVTFQDSARSSGPASLAIGLSPRGRRVKKEACYQCLKGSRFTEKEACLACDAKYCSGCVLWAMGSMPEGRKCVSCIGSSIMETKMEKLGKPSRMLKRLLSSLEVQQVMRSEMDCEANQLRPDDICVNEKKLTQEEMVLLQSCPCPPSKLKPGYYWYDKFSGFWGKQGHKPHKVISPNLNVGGNIMKNASNGNTGVLINGREITKVELRMLKWAGVQCAGKPHFWVNADGTYQEEGQKNIKGQIWGKPILKLLGPVLSLPIPSNPSNLSGEEVNNMVNRAVPDYLEQKTLRRLLLVGDQGSGTSTIFKQAKFLYGSVPFSEDERQDIKLVIQRNIYNYLGILLEGREWFEEESLTDKRKSKQFHSSGPENNGSDEHDMTEYYISPRLKAFSDWLLKIMASGNLEAVFPAATRVYAPLVEELWNAAAIQATYRRRNELRLLPSVASYFLEQVVDICRVEYEPSDMDILYADGITSSNGLACTDFFFPCLAGDGNGNDVDDHLDTLLIRYQLIRLHTKSLGEKCKWLDMFEDVRLVIFCVALSDYDEYFEDANGVGINKMMESKRLFESIVGHPALDQMDFLLILNKFDLLEQKIDMASLTLCEWFDDFNPVVSHNRPNNNNSRNISNGATMAQQAFHYIAVKFKKLFYSLTGRKLHVTLANGLDLDSVDAALRYAWEILKWEDERLAFGEAVDSTEPSSYSQ